MGESSYNAESWAVAQHCAKAWCEQDASGFLMGMLRLTNEGREVVRELVLDQHCPEHRIPQSAAFTSALREIPEDDDACQAMWDELMTGLPDGVAVPVALSLN